MSDTRDFADRFVSERFEFEGHGVRGHGHAAMPELHRSASSCETTEAGDQEPQRIVDTKRPDGAFRHRGYFEALLSCLLTIFKTIS